MSPRLFADPTPPAFGGIDLRCCDVADVLREARGARLIHADPPWRYAREAGVANPEEQGIYAALSEAEIVAHLDAAWDCAGAHARLVCWYTWPKAAEWRAAGAAGPRWGAEVTGGAWTKAGTFGVGYHWRGYTEPVAVFTRGANGRPNEPILNGHISEPGAHSEKPIGWLREMLRAWTKPGDLVLDLYAGRATMARACRLEGRRYLGAEIDPDRHRAACSALAMVRP